MAASLRAGNAGSNTTADHVEVLTAAIAQVPTARRKHLLIRSDGAGASHGLLDWLTTQNEIRGRSVEHGLGFPISSAVRQAIGKVPKAAWVPAVEADGSVRAGGDVVEVTGLLNPAFVKRWPAGMRVIVRRERPHPGARLSLFEENDGYRYQAFVTSTKVGQIAHLEARHRAHARVEDHIRHAKDTGLRRFPSREFAIDQAWLGCVMLAADLVAWTRLLALHGDATELRSCEPKALRYRLWHVPARLTRGGRQRRLRIPQSWPWTTAIVAVFANIAAIPDPT